MKLEPIKSSALKAHGYDPETQKMRVQTHGGKVYEYDNIPLERYAAFTGAQSPGQFWNKRIKPHHSGREIK